LDGVKDVTEFPNYLELELADGIDSNDVLKRIVERVAV
jgi:hypothetical protein